jgi:hypothetical protein
MVNIGILHYFLGLQVLPLYDGLFTSKSKYVMDILTHFKMENNNPCATPFQYGVKLSKTCQSPQVDAILYRQLVKNIIYLTHSRLDIYFVVCVVSHFMQDPREIHWKYVKIIGHFLKRTTHFGIKYCQSSDYLVGLIDSTRLTIMMIRIPPMAICFSSALDHWFGRARNIR